MSSLSTVYGIGAALGTVTAFIAAYAGHKIYPIQTGGNITSAIENVKNTVQQAAENFMKPKVEEQPLNTDVTPLEPPVEETQLPEVDLAPQNNPFSSTEQPSTA